MRAGSRAGSNLPRVEGFDSTSPTTCRWGTAVILFARRHSVRLSRPSTAGERQRVARTRSLGPTLPAAALLFLLSGTGAAQEEPTSISYIIHDVDVTMLRTRINTGGFWGQLDLLGTADTPPDFAVFAIDYRYLLRRGPWALEVEYNDGTLVGDRIWRVGVGFTVEVGPFAARARGFPYTLGGRSRQVGLIYHLDWQPFRLAGWVDYDWIDDFGRGVSSETELLAFAGHGLAMLVMAGFSQFRSDTLIMSIGGRWHPQ